MGLHTKYLGHVLVDPPLNPFEERFLRSFRHTRRWHRPDGPYVVLDHPMQEEDHDDLDRYNRPAPGEPALWCGWTPCLDGCCLSVDSDSPEAPDEWLDYLIEHFLGPGGRAMGEPGFAAFTFDHVVNGVVFGAGSETREVFAVECVDNVVRRISLMPGVSLAKAWGDDPGFVDRAVRLDRRRW